MREWSLYSLPNDNFSLENAIININTRRWPLFIDPQGQANKWLKNMEKDNNLVCLKFGIPTFLREVTAAVKIGRPVVVQDVEEANARKTMSLNIEVRKSEREEELAKRLERENERRKALNLEPLASLEDIEEDDFPDILLDQAAGIVTDMAEIREIGAPARTTAQVTP